MKSMLEEQRSVGRTGNSQAVGLWKCETERTARGAEVRKINANVAAASDGERRDADTIGPLQLS